jgi:hypothetical protein
MKISTMTAMALGATIATLAFSDAKSEPTTGDIIGAYAEQGGRSLSSGVATAATSTAEALDGFTFNGLRVAQHAAGNPEDRTMTTGNALVALFYRAPVAVAGAAVGVTSAVLSVPMKGIAYGFGWLARGEGDAT